MNDYTFSKMGAGKTIDGLSVLDARVFVLWQCFLRTRAAVEAVWRVQLLQHVSRHVT